MKAPSLLLLLLIVALASVLIALSVGSVAVTPADLWQVLTGDADPTRRAVLLDLRLPRALSAFATGAALALAGALMQVLLRNPLADPYVLGISGGAAAAALLVMLLGLGTLWITAGAFAGALGSMLLVFGLARGAGAWTPTRLLLTGVVIAAGWGALISFLLSISADTTLRGMLFWLMGDLAQSSQPLGGLLLIALGLLLSQPLAGQLNVLAHGELQAGALGVAVQKLRWQLYVLASLLTAGAVAIAGTVGFVGLVTPHLLRLAGITDYRRLLPASVLAGGSLLTLADSVARTLLAPQQLPVGVITAFLGVPLFLFLLKRGSGRL